MVIKLLFRILVGSMENRLWYRFNGRLFLRKLNSRSWCLPAKTTAWPHPLDVAFFLQWSKKIWKCAPGKKKISIYYYFQPWLMNYKLKLIPSVEIIARREGAVNLLIMSYSLCKFRHEGVQLDRIFLFPSIHVCRFWINLSSSYPLCL